MDEAVQAFEEDMFRRAAIIAAVTKGNMEDTLFTEGASERTMPTFVRRMLVGEMPWLEYLIPLWFVKLVLRIWFKW